MSAMSRLRLPIAIIVATIFAAALAFAAFSVAFPSTAEARHNWAKYHWGTTSKPFTIVLGDNLSTAWDGYLSTTAGALTPDDGHNDWNGPYDKWDGFTYTDVMNPKIEAGTTTGATCAPKSGRVEVCNAEYGTTGWLGVAQIWISRNHITQGTAKNNDTYFKQARYNTDAWKNLVMCQEVAHTFGLDHQDENFNNTNLGSCMDYTNAPGGGTYNGKDYGLTNEYPNKHDYEQLMSIYGHNDPTSTLTASAASDLPAAANEVTSNDRRQWGRLIHSSSEGRIQKFERDFGNGMRAITLVIWADEHEHDGTEPEPTDGGSHQHR